MITDEGLKKLAARIQALGYDEATARRYAALIGDEPAEDDNGLLCVIDHGGEILARLPLKYFDE